MTPSDKAPLVGWMILEDYCEDMSQWDGVITYPDPTGANLAWQNPTKMIEYSAYEKLQARLTKCESMRETACANALMFNEKNIELQAQAAQFNKERDIWHENRKEMAEAYVELKEKLQAAEAERDKLLCGDLYKHWEKQNIELQAQLAAAEAEIERLRHGHYKDDHRFHPLKAENDNLRAEIERLNINLTEQAKDHADDWKRIQDAELKLEEALAREKH